MGNISLLFGLIFCVLLPLFTDQKIIPAESGLSIILPCQAPNNNNIKAVEWSRADLELEHVLLYRDDQFVTRQQHPSFKNRVDLQDRHMKDGDVSLILKNVTINDAGTYECRVFMSAPNNEHICNISLSVVPPGQTGGHTQDGGKEDGGKEDGGKEDGPVGLIVGLSVCAVLLVAAVVGFLIYRKHKQQQSQDSY